MSEDLVWEGTLDSRYTVTVIRTGPYHGGLSIREGDQILKVRHQLMFGCMLTGPAVLECRDKGRSRYG